MAMTGRRPGGAAAGWPEGCAGAVPLRPADAAIERTSHTFVPATINEPTSMAAHNTATWLFLTSSSSVAAAAAAPLHRDAGIPGACRRKPNRVERPAEH